MFAPRNTPSEIIARLYRAIAAIARSPEFNERMAALGIEPEGNDPDQFAAQLREEIAKWAKVVKSAGVKVD